MTEHGANHPASMASGASTPRPDLGGVEEQHRLLMACLTDHAIFFLDPRGLVATWNAGAERTFGYAAAEIVGQPLSRLFAPEDIQNGLPGK
jgi:PAS domain-containing protein